MVKLKKLLLTHSLGFAIVGQQGDGDDVEVETDPLNGLTSINKGQL